MTPEDLRRKADEYDAATIAAAERGDIAEGARLSFLAEGLRRMASEQERLQAAIHHGNQWKVEPDTSHIPRQDLVQLARAAGTSLREIAEGIGRSHGLISKAQHAGRPFDRKLAKRIQELTRSAAYPDGFEPTPANWPGGLRD